MGAATSALLIPTRSPIVDATTASMIARATTGTTRATASAYPRRSHGAATGALLIPTRSPIADATTASMIARATTGTTRATASAYPRRSPIVDATTASMIALSSTICFSHYHLLPHDHGAW